MTKRRWLLVASVVALIVATRARANATVDLTGNWYMRFDFSFNLTTLPVDIVQTGTALVIKYTPTGSTLFTGTIDVDTGAFTVTGELCSGTPDTLTGTAALDSSTFGASGTVHFPPFFCNAFPATVSGVRGLCGDGVLTPEGEACDDGNTASGDCCSANCTFEPTGSPCSDGNPATCEACDGNGSCQSSVCPSFDLSGAWSFTYFFSSACLQFVQNGISLTATFCNSSSAVFTGTVDPATRHFFITQPPDSCELPGQGHCELDATAAPNFLSWSGTFNCEFFKATPPVGCFGDIESVTGTPERCGDGFTNTAAGEECDAGSDLAGDCCSPTCHFEPAATPCNNGDPLVCGTCNGFGACYTDTCPFVLDHYKCYQGRDLRSPSFLQGTVVTSDQLSSELVRLVKPEYVCAPVDQNGEGINDPTAHLVCYHATAALLDPRPRVEVSSQFQTSRFELKRSRLLCVPATKTLLP